MNVYNFRSLIAFQHLIVTKVDTSRLKTAGGFGYYLVSH